MRAGSRKRWGEPSNGMQLGHLGKERRKEELGRKSLRLWYDSEKVLARPMGLPSLTPEEILLIRGVLPWAETA